MSIRLTRRSLLGAAAATALMPPLLGTSWRGAHAQDSSLHLGTAQPFTFETLIQRAEAAAKAAYRSPYRPMPEVTQEIDYDAWGKIKFNTDLSPYAQEGSGGAYPIVFFHLGQFFQKSVRMHLVQDSTAREVMYAPSYFTMPDDSPARRLPEDSGFAGFRLQEWWGAEDWRTQDWVAFLGASYFRAIGALGQYGLSARGVAINPAVPDAPEEFPDFTDFYISESPDPEQPVTVCALLDGPSVTGAYRFSMTRGQDRSKGVVMDIECSLFLREDVKRLGLMPLTSMFWYAEYGRARMEDWRPEVHDSDGLALWTGAGERIWRPIRNPSETRISAFGDDSPKGFGLLQRDRNFDHYRDGVFYERRPSLWVEPLKPLGKGSVQLLEIPTDDEIHDNIGAFWVPEQAAVKGSRYDLSYRLHWVDQEPFPATNVAQVISTRYGRGGQPGKPRPQGVYKIAIEFDNPPVLTQIPYGVFPTIEITTSRGEVTSTLVEPVPGGNVWRAIFDLTVAGTDIVEMRGYMALDGKPLTETWLAQFAPNNPGG